MKKKLDKAYRIFLSVMVGLMVAVPAIFVLVLIICLIIVLFFL